MNIIDKINEELSLSPIMYKGRSAWIAREVGSAVGYSHGGKRLVTEITREWSNEFIEGIDYAVLRYGELSKMKAVLEPGKGRSFSRTPSLVILFESGLVLALIKLNKGQTKVRRILVDEALAATSRSDRKQTDSKEAVVGELQRTCPGKCLRSRELEMERLASERAEKWRKINFAKEVIGSLNGNVGEEVILGMRMKPVDVAFETNEWCRMFRLGVFLPSLAQPISDSPSSLVQQN